MPWGSCDVCGDGEMGDQVYVEDLREQYQTAGIKKLCSPCLRIANKKLDSFQELSRVSTSHWFRRWLGVFKRSKSGD